VGFREWLAVPHFDCLCPSKRLAVQHSF
jgi:hypothetical protein